eukprot:scaffold15100_cov61-Phaeocystis_antarctica.AAC.2
MSLAPLDRRAAPLRRCCGACDAVMPALRQRSLRTDAELAILGRQELSDEVALSKAQDAVLGAMSAKKEPVEIAELQAMVVELKVCR